MDPTNLPKAGPNLSDAVSGADPTLFSLSVDWLSMYWPVMLVIMIVIGVMISLAADALSEADDDGFVPTTPHAVIQLLAKAWNKLGGYADKEKVGIASIIFWLLMLAGLIICALGVFVLNIGNFMVLMPAADAGLKIKSITIGTFKMEDVPYVVALLSGAYVALDIVVPAIVRQCQDICDENHDKRDRSAYKTARFFFWFLFFGMGAMVLAEAVIAFYRGMFVEGGSSGVVSGPVMMVVAPVFVIGSMATSYFVKWKLESGITFIGFLLNVIFSIIGLVAGMPMAIIIYNGRKLLSNIGGLLFNNNSNPSESSKEGE